MSRKRADELDSWSVWLRDALVERGRTARVTYEDKIGGDVLLIAIDAAERDKLVELTVARPQKGRGNAHLTVMATTEDGIGSTRDTMARLHTEISRLANAKRKFVHRIDRLVAELSKSWPARSREPMQARDEALATLRQVLPDAIPTLGIGFKVALAGDDEQRTREVYPTLWGAALPLEGTWRGLAWDATKHRWVARAATLDALLKLRPGADLERGGISLGDVGITMAAAAVGAATIASMGGGDFSQEVQAKVNKPQSGSSCNFDWADSINPCDIVDCVASASDLGNCVPDCNFDLGALDCGGLDCSL